MDNLTNSLNQMIDHQRRAERCQGDEQDFTHLSPAELSGLVDLVAAQIEWHRDEIVRLRPILRRLQEQVPDDYNNLMNQVKQVLNNLD